MKVIKLTADKFNALYDFPWNTIDTVVFLDVSPKPFKKGQNILLTDGGGSTRCIGVMVETIHHGIQVSMRLP